MKPYFLNAIQQISPLQEDILARGKGWHGSCGCRQGQTLGSTETTSGHLSKPLSQQPWGNVDDQRLSSKGEQKKCCLGSGKHMEISVSSLSFPARLPAQFSPPPPPSLNVILCKWSQTHSFWFWDGKKRSHPSLSAIQASSIITNMLSWKNICLLSTSWQQLCFLYFKIPWNIGQLSLKLS